MGLGLSFGPIGRALGKWIESKVRAPESPSETVLTLQARVAELEQGAQRMAELEERLDFAERMLAQQREPDRIRGG